ncbi:MAG: hypothetical protein LBU40_04115 [Methanobrevibacter sp.]|jgi:hypothetical protein|nr:hypothetical protein [Methanobrevibacter sp.]
MTQVVPNINSTFSTANIMFEFTQKVAEYMSISRFIPKMKPNAEGIQEYDSFIEISKPKLSLEDAIAKGEIGELHKMADNSEYFQLGVREYTSEKLNIERIAGVLDLSPGYFKKIINNPNRLAADIAPLFSNAYNNAILTALNEIVADGGTSSYTQDADETYSNFLIKANAAYAAKNGFTQELDTMLVSGKSITAISEEIDTLDNKVVPTEDLKKYFGVNGIKYKLKDTRTFNGGTVMDADPDSDPVKTGKESYGFRYGDSPLSVIYLPVPEFQAMPSGVNITETLNDFTPMVNYLQQFIEKPLPKTYKLYFETKFGIVKDDPAKLFVGQNKYDQT